MYKRVILAMACLFAGTQFLNGQRQVLSLNEAILLARKNSVDAAVALNELRTAYWEYRTFRAEQLPELSFTTTFPS